MTPTTTKTLYDTDFALWIDETVDRLKAGDFAAIDLDNLIEEVESLGISQRKSVHSFLVRLLEHLLKRCYVPLPDCYRGWEIESRNFRNELKKEFKYSPSLKSFLVEIFEESYGEALESVREDYPDTDFPGVWPFAKDVDTLLTEKFWRDEQ
ncbi:MAG: DUF29 domain-containing protein [Microcystis aeruginosa L211-07]|jgi:hypothetical protein|nr:DUF29 domain-containing protein [Microcystis aeruginosa L211-07]